MVDAPDQLLNQLGKSISVYILSGQRGHVIDIFLIPNSRFMRFEEGEAAPEGLLEQFLQGRQSILVGRGKTAKSGKSKLCLA